MKRKTTSFDTHGTEGMLDVVLGCTLIFLLLTALVKVNEGQSQERTLPDMDLTESQAAAIGSTEIKRTVISLEPKNGAPRIWIDEDEVPLDQLETELAALGPGTRVALRRDRELPCKLEDQVILACRRAGIERVAIVIQAKETKQ